ncbi:MAG TPA: alpha/beta fold hydrolase [Thermoanaerobaculia bacterium]|nr:alpha/beta fold hydrolase [Thermoanaerobaculia bacterium]
MAPPRPFRLTTGPRPLDGLLDLPDGDAPAPVVVVCHGFKGFMEWGFFPTLASLLAARGLAVVRFNFSGGGVRPGEDLVSDLAAFREDTVARGLEDVDGVLREVVADELAPGRLEPSRLALFGHSRGGGLALLAAASAPWRERLAALVTWAAVATFDRIGDDDKARWRQTGTYTVVNARTGQQLPLGLAVLEDVEGHREAYDLEAAAARRRAPWQLVHGEMDPTVPVREAENLLAAAAPPVACERIATGDHTFGAKHPFQGPTPQLTAALNTTQAWLLRHLRPGG